MDLTRLKERKRELGYTNEMISERSGVPLSTVNKIFGGITTAPRYTTLKSLECVLFPEDTEKEEAALYREMAENRFRNSGYVAESSALDEYGVEHAEGEHKAAFEKIFSWKKPGEFTKGDLDKLPAGMIMELIDGILYDRSSPSAIHQFISLKLSARLDAAIEESGGNCLVLAAPTDVQPDKDDDRNVLIPDVLIVCDREKYENGEEVIGAPDFVAEILSPSTEKNDRFVKLNKYWKAGVREYWIVNTDERQVWVYMFGKKAELQIYSFEDSIPLGISGGKIEVDFRKISDGIRAHFGR